MKDAIETGDVGHNDVAVCIENKKNNANKTKKKNNEPLTLDEIEPYHGYQSGTDVPCIHCGGKRYVFVDIVQIPKDKSNDGTGFVSIITCECCRVVNGAECRDVLNVVDKNGEYGRVVLGLDILSKMMEDDYNESKENVLQTNFGGSGIVGE
jgi:hypothetical protein